MLNKTFFTDTEHKDKYFRNFLENVVSSLPLEAKETPAKYVFQFDSKWHDKVNRSRGIAGF